MWEGIRRVKRFFEPPQEKSVFEQQKEVIDAAAEWDTLTAFPAWTKALRHLAEEVNATLIEATKHEANPAEMMWHVVRWNAKRQLLDNLQAQIESDMRERDRIIAEYKEIEREHAEQSSYGN